MAGAGEEDKELDDLLDSESWKGWGLGVLRGEEESREGVSVGGIDSLLT